MSKKEKQSTEINRRVDKLSNYNRKDRKLISKIFGIIMEAADRETAEKIIRKIEEEL